MNPHPIFMPAPRRVRRKRQPPAVTAATLNLVGAVYTESTEVTLTFDRAIDIAGLDGGEVIVDDAAYALGRYAGTGPAFMSDAYTVTLGLNPVGPATGSGVTLTAGGASGIVAAGDGTEWAGASSLELPCPPE